ncbi:hypothetical protein CMS0498 [Clavibacter sepedonicus]|uniref:Uncharacterized protein n=1 Tax=Clavibacter sepedonicus TaxID=31964 RepID=B0RD20_CLASE|nr:hypothetical protein CMS0498 [Clavibacter sepedonicus]
MAASALTDTNTGSEHIFFAFGYGVYAVLAPSEQTHILKTVDDHADDAVAAVCAKRGDLCAFGTGAVASLVATMTSPQGTHAVPCLATEDYRLVLKGPGASKCVAHTES